MQYKDFYGYIVYASGKVINKNTGKQIKPQENNCGYLRVQMCNGSLKPRFFVHRLVAEIYIPNPLNLPQVNHKDGNKKNNDVSNLEWVSASQNRKHAFSELGLKPTRVCGADSGACKITLEQLSEAASKVASGRLIKDVALDYGIHRKYLGALLSGRVKRHG
jgi:hypothetical protein